jgi:ribosome biogenesis GTPase A
MPQRKFARFRKMYKGESDATLIDRAEVRKELAKSYKDVDAIMKVLDNRKPVATTFAVYQV